MTELGKKGFDYINNQVDKGNADILSMIGELVTKNEELNDFSNSQCAKLLKKNEELQKENGTLKFENHDLCEYIKVLKEENEKLKEKRIDKSCKCIELKAQIEKMKCCENCKHHRVFCLLDEPCECYWNNWELA